MDITKQTLQSKLEQYERSKQTAIDQANALHGAILVIKELIAEIEKPTDASAKTE